MDTAKSGNEYNKAFAKYLNGIEFHICSDGSKMDSHDIEMDSKIADGLIALTRKILEPEWRRVKEEAKGRK